MHLARPREPRLEPIPAVAAKAREAMKSQPINAVKALGGKCKTALVISRVKDNHKGWQCTRKYFRRVPASR